MDAYVPEKHLDVKDIIEPRTGLETEFRLRATVASSGEVTGDPARFWKAHRGSSELVARPFCRVPSEHDSPQRGCSHVRSERDILHASSMGSETLVISRGFIGSATSRRTPCSERSARDPIQERLSVPWPPGYPSKVNRPGPHPRSASQPAINDDLVALSRLSSRASWEREVMVR